MNKDVSWGNVCKHKSATYRLTNGIKRSFIKIKCFAHFVNRLKACCPFVIVPAFAKNRLSAYDGACAIHTVRMRVVTANQFSIKYISQSCRVNVV